MRPISSLTALVLLLTACQAEYQEEALHGQWSAVAITEEGSPLAVDPSLIRLQFLPNGMYAYQSTLNYKEAGSYFLESRYLYTRDTLNQASTERAVQVLQLAADTLRLKMMDGGKERLMTLVRE